MPMIITSSSSPAFVPVESAIAERHQAIASKLKTLDAETLSRLQDSFFEMASRAENSAQSGFVPFAMRKPADVLDQNRGLLEKSYFESAQDTKSLKRNYSAPNLSGSRAFSSPATDKAGEAVRNSKAQTQNFIANHLGRMFASGANPTELAPNVCYEDALAAAMMAIADKGEKDVMEQIRSVERGETGLGAFVGNGARSLGGIAGGAVGGYLGGVSGAAIGHDVGERMAGSVANQYGGSSRQVQFEKLKMFISKQSEMMSAISNILATIHSTNKNTISNMRG